ncbi:hypothetical protein DFA_01369 [Cavenderia fasciculata]|uniref:Uncharacterized protein n=1 Tax=Cavenderia fasciculata TaxID=261658 RepID=F4PSF3_CACFS|nr:uncharacterized protein DFA_01369 [Cavenderia fasciculata]EGG21483.1 hypothetical protein DFA_01369 [Cavenderia fasciculata]|eukprot:XP_004359333.1 hypothetical protein DFA_01369 [Cavenderia fasciculata]
MVIVIISLKIIEYIKKTNIKIVINSNVCRIQFSVVPDMTGQEVDDYQI